MRALKTVQRFLTCSLQVIHQNRLKAIFWAVGSLLLGSRLSLTSIGRAAKGTAYTKHNIKRVDRLLSNRLLHKEINVFYRAIAKTLIGSRTRPIILIDWTGSGDRHWALVAAVPVDGRAIPIFTRVYSEKKNNNPVIHKSFLRQLHGIIPPNCKPIIVTDAGFQNVWFRDVVSWGWDYVGRLITNAHACRKGDDNWFASFDLFKKATFKAKELGNYFLAKRNPFLHRLITIRNKPAGRKSIFQGKKDALEAKHRAKKPWLLVTSLNQATAKKVVQIYASRMQIEESFRDIKNHRYGWSFRHARSKSKTRKEVLFLIAAIGMLSLMLIGRTGERFKLQNRYQANTVKDKRVLSLFFLGKNILAKEQDFKLFSHYEYCVSLEELKEKILSLKEVSR